MDSQLPITQTLLNLSFKAQSLVLETTQHLDSVAQSAEAVASSDDALSQNDVITDLIDDFMGSGNLNIIGEELVTDDGSELLWTKDGMGKTSVFIVTVCTVFVVAIFIYYLVKLAC